MLNIVYEPKNFDSLLGTEGLSDQLLKNHFMLYYDSWADRLFDAWINEHDGGHFCGATPLLIMDVFEHACMVDYGLKRADYIEAFFKAIDWRVEDWVDKSCNLQDQSIHRCSQ